MSALGRYIVDAVILERRSPTELARDHGITRRWIHKLVKRFKEGGYAALEPRSRRPHSCSCQTAAEVATEVLRLRQELVTAGHDAGPESIAHLLIGRVDRVPSVTTVWRLLRRNGLITPQPHKRPRSSFIRFEAQLPNETWQVDATPWQLADGTQVEILNFEDDRSRLFVGSTAYPTVKAADVVHAFHAASSQFGLPASLLSDNGRIFTARSIGAKVMLESELERLGIDFKHSTPYHPQTCGKVERLHQTLKRFLAKQTAARSLTELQFQLDAFRDYYNSRRAHRALERRTPLAVFNSLLKARPVERPAPTDHRVRQDKIDAFGKVTLRYLGRLRHIPVGVEHKNRRVQLLIAGPDVRIITPEGQLIRALSIDPTRNYQPLGGRWPVHNVLQQARTMS